MWWLEEDDDENETSELEYAELEDTEERRNRSRNRIIVDLGQEENLVIYEDEGYTPGQLDEMTDQILRAHCKTVDPETNRPRGIGGENPILFEEHIYSRKRREIYNQNGTPDPNIASGIYWRAHPQGRKITTPEQRKKNGASWYR